MTVNNYVQMFIHLVSSYTFTTLLEFCIPLEQFTPTNLYTTLVGNSFKKAASPSYKQNEYKLTRSMHSQHSLNICTTKELLITEPLISFLTVHCPNLLRIPGE